MATQPFYKTAHEMADEIDEEDSAMLHTSINIFRRNGFSFGDQRDTDQIPILQFSHRKITSQVAAELNAKLSKFKEAILKGFDAKSLQSFDWGIPKVEEYFPEVLELSRNTETFSTKLLQIKPIEEDPSKFYAHKDKYFFFDEQTKSYYYTPWLPCSYCSQGSVGPGTNKSTSIGFYCGCQDNDNKY